MISTAWPGLEKGLAIILGSVGILAAIWLFIEIYLTHRYRTKAEQSRQAVDGNTPPRYAIQDSQVHIHDGGIFVDSTPIARFTQRFEMLDKVIPLKNRQILTFFVPNVVVEFVNGRRDPVPLPKAKFEELVTEIEAVLRAHPERFEGWEPLRVKPGVIEATESADADE